MKKGISLFLFLFSLQYSYSEKIPVKIFSGAKIDSLNISVVKGSYDVVCNGKILLSLSPAHNGSIRVALSKYGLGIRSESGPAGPFNNISLKSDAGDGILELQCSESNSAIRGSFDDDLEISSENNFLNMINKVFLEKYVASVLSAEIGYNAQPEFLKAEAIICRTYAVFNLNRHEKENYGLCSDVHCQVYKGNKEVTTQIIRSVNATEGKIITDSLGKVIISAFHSNCGGRTQNSEDAWTGYRSYLRSVTDTFCLSQPHARWEQKISAKNWNSNISGLSPDSYETIQNNFSRTDSGKSQMPGRPLVSRFRGLPVSVKKVRAVFGLKSSWFTLTEASDSILIQGRGYGHGVGLCQEGAMRMADLDHSCDDIIHYYYTGVFISRRP